jgi:hypothetical protein
MREGAGFASADTRVRRRRSRTSRRCRLLTRLLKGQPLVRGLPPIPGAQVQAQIQISSR